MSNVEKKNMPQCNFSVKPADKIHKLIEGFVGDIFICDACIKNYNEILEDDHITDFNSEYAINSKSFKPKD